MKGGAEDEEEEKKKKMMRNVSKRKKREDAKWASGVLGGDLAWHVLFWGKETADKILRFHEWLPVVAHL